MDKITTIDEMSAYSAKKSGKGKKIAFVPTMGALHAGHVALVKKAKELGDIVVLSSFLNPKQFNDPTDLEKYPRTPEADEKTAKDAGVDVYFSPTADDMYPPGFLTSVNVSYLSSQFEGQSRPGHFRGVCTVLLKLFHIVKPTHAVFGLKDAQQFTIIKHMVHDLCIDVEIVGVPTVRDKDGLALSSRNVRLSPEQRERALCMHRAFKRAHFLITKQGILHAGELMQAVTSTVKRANVELDYAAIVNRNTLEPLDHVMRGGTYILLAINLDGIRLIDNTRI